MKDLGVAYFFEAKMFDVYGPPLDPSVAEKMDQTTATCNEKCVCFLMSADYYNKLN